MALGLAPLGRTTDDVARALDPTTTGSELLQLAIHKSTSVRAALASRIDCPMGAMLALGHDKHDEVLVTLVGNPRAPETLIRQLAESRKQNVRELAQARLRRNIA